MTWRELRTHAARVVRCARGDSLRARHRRFHWKPPIATRHRRRRHPLSVLHSLVITPLLHPDVFPTGEDAAPIYRSDAATGTRSHCLDGLVNTSGRVDSSSILVMRATRVGSLVPRVGAASALCFVQAVRRHDWTRGITIRLISPTVRSDTIEPSARLRPSRFSRVVLRATRNGQIGPVDPRRAWTRCSFSRTSIETNGRALAPGSHHGGPRVRCHLRITHCHPGPTMPRSRRSTPARSDPAWSPAAGRFAHEEHAEC